MRRSIILSITLTIFLASCYEPYYPRVNSNQKVLVVNGMITDEYASYQIQLSYAAPFDSTGTGTPVDNAKVYVTDNLGKKFSFYYYGNGYYVSSPMEFTGHPGNAYNLHIITPDGEEYESDSQRLFPEVHPDSVYSEFDYKEILEKSSGSMVLSHGGDILVDVKNHSDTLPHFRFAANLVTQYFYSVCPMFQSCILYYCWQTDNANSDINLTGGEYSIGSASINKHNVCFIDDNLFYYGIVYTSRSTGGSTYYAVPTTQYQSFQIVNRILYLQQYTLNNETYEYYKNINLQLQSEGKLFDPIAAQLYGNIKCISDPYVKALGFFEASSVSHSAYKIDFRNLTDNQPSIKQISYILPPASNGCEINNFPAFWIN